MSTTRRRRRSESEWAGLLDQWSKSGETAERFAARIGVTPATLLRWSKALGVVAQRESPAVGQAKDAQSNDSLFARVQVVKPAPRADALIEVVMRNGIMLRVHGQVEGDTLGVLLEALSQC